MAPSSISISDNVTSLLCIMYAELFGRVLRSVNDLLREMLVLNTRGHSRTSTRRSVGREAQIMPTWTSMVDHQATIHWSQVGLKERAR